MQDQALNRHRLGWIGVGRMGYALAARLLEAGCDLAVYNRTRSKAEPLAELGATVVDSPADLADRDIVFTMVAGSDDLREVAVGPDGVIRPDGGPSILVDCSTVSPVKSGAVRAEAAERGTAFLAAPVSGNPRVVEAGRMTMVVSGPEDAYSETLPYLERLSAGVTYVGGDQEARLVKICHNVMLGVVAQTLAEITVLAEKGGVARADFLDFLNRSVMGSAFTRYKTPALVKLDFTPTFTPELLLKDFDLGFEAAEQDGVPMPVAAAARAAVIELIASGRTEVDFAALIELEAEAAGLELEPEDGPVSDGLEPAGVS